MSWQYQQSLASHLEIHPISKARAHGKRRQSEQRCHCCCSNPPCPHPDLEWYPAVTRYGNWRPGNLSCGWENPCKLRWNTEQQKHPKENDPRMMALKNIELLIYWSLLLCGWETLSSSLAPNSMGIMNALSFLDPA